MNRMNFRRIFATGLTCVVLMSATACSKKPNADVEVTSNVDAVQMSIPETDAVAYVESEPIDISSWAAAEPDKVIALKTQDVDMTTGGTVRLLALDTESDPITAANEITSLNENLVLNSSGTILGDGSLRDLVESKLLRWTENSGFTDVEYTQPVAINANRYMVHLMLKSDESITEQTVVYTDLGDGVARIDRLWRTINDGDMTSDADFDAVANSLISDETL